MIKWPILNKLTGFSVAKEATCSIYDLIAPHVEQHEKTLDSNNIRDFLDVLILEQHDKKESDSCFNSRLGKATMMNALLDLFLAGMETTSSSLVMAILHLLHHPDVQSKVHAELDKVITIYYVKLDFCCLISENHKTKKNSL
jgi:cytochrome P450